MKTITLLQRQQSLVLLALFCFCLIAFRIIFTQQIFYGFLIINLALAIVPYAISTVLQLSPRLAKSNFLIVAVSLGWLLFLPNAPYIVTDILHFKKESTMPEWFDVLMLVSFSCSGLAFGYSSMAVMEMTWQSRFGQKIANGFILLSCLLSGFGIFLGRFLRYNSWDILSKPVELFTDLPPLLLQPKAIGFSLGYGLFFFLFYRFFMHTKSSI